MAERMTMTDDVGALTALFSAHTASVVDHAVDETVAVHFAKAKRQAQAKSSKEASR
jgi:demethoxyubiquinone hydroxylase (CLK1/Coq7/Cat5 family)